MGKNRYESQIGKAVESFASHKTTKEPAPVAAPPEPVVSAVVPERTVSVEPQYTPPKAKRPAGRPKKNGELIKISLGIPAALYEAVKADANERGGGNVSRTIILSLAQKYGIEIH